MKSQVFFLASQSNLPKYRFHTSLTQTQVFYKIQPLQASNNFTKKELMGKSNLLVTNRRIYKFRAH